jgi:hypothetical protein
MRIIAIVAAITMLAFTRLALAQDKTSEPPISTSDLDRAAKVKDYYGGWLSSIPGVSDVHVGNSDQGKPEIEIEIEEMTPQIKTIPGELNGIPVVVKKPPNLPSEPTD